MPSKDIEEILYRYYGTSIVDGRGQPNHAKILEATQAIEQLIAEARIDELDKAWCDLPTTDLVSRQRYLDRRAELKEELK